MARITLLTGYTLLGGKVKAFRRGDAPEVTVESPEGALVLEDEAALQQALATLREVAERFADDWHVGPLDDWGDLDLGTRVGIEVVVYERGLTDFEQVVVKRQARRWVVVHCRSTPDDPNDIASSWVELSTTAATVDVLAATVAALLPREVPGTPSPA